MRLINVHTLKLESFPNKKTRPPYAVLSHRWLDNEATFDAFTSDPSQTGSGFDKIRSLCAIIRQQQVVHNVKYCWIDTCCIDKRSSTELSEAINSMASWYAASKVCIVHLFDVLPMDVPIEGPSGAALRASIYRSEWFTRGWTLQELLFPPKLIFYDCHWGEIRGLETYHSMLSAITHIPVECLQHRENVSKYCIADRMSWAARRETTREEDQSYCLLGIFGINMPLLYGEGGANAFNRLQKAIIDNSEDESIFAWVSTPKTSNHLDCGLMPVLAPQLAYFAYSERKHTNRALFEQRSPYRITNRGLELEASAIEMSTVPQSPWPHLADDELGKQLFLLQINCTATYDVCGAQPWVIVLQRLSRSNHVPVYARLYSWTSPYMITKIITDWKKNNNDVLIFRHPPRKYYIATSYDQIQTQASVFAEATKISEEAIPSNLEALFERLSKDST